MIDIASDDFLYPVLRTGNRGRPVNTGRKDFHLLYDMAEMLAADSKLSQAEAARRVAGPEDHTAWDRLPRKLRQLPHLLSSARVRREKQVLRYLEALKCRRLEASFIGFRTRAAATSYVQLLALVSPDVATDPRVAAAEKAFWSAIKPNLIEEILNRQRDLENLLGLSRTGALNAERALIAWRY